MTYFPSDHPAVEVAEIWDYAQIFVIILICGILIGALSVGYDVYKRRVGNDQPGTSTGSVQKVR